MMNRLSNLSTAPKRVIRCTQCQQALRVPVKIKSIQVHCPNCHHKFILKITDQWIPNNALAMIQSYFRSWSQQSFSTRLTRIAIILFSMVMVSNLLQTCQQVIPASEKNYQVIEPLTPRSSSEVETLL